MTICIGDWVMVDSFNRKYKGYVMSRNAYDTIVNVYVPNIKDFSPHSYPNAKVTALPLDTFENSSEMIIDASLLLGCKDTFMEITNNENRRV